MRFDIVSLFPETFTAITQYGVVGRAVQEKLLQLKLWQLRDFAEPPHYSVDDRPYGGGPGMVMSPDVLNRALEKVCENLPERPLVVAMSASGDLLNQNLVEQLSSKKHLVVMAGRYAGMDERFLQTCVDMQISVGDYVVSGGELPAMLLVDAVARQLDGVLGNAESAVDDAFSGGLLDYPRYTRPGVYQGLEVPQVLLNGNHEDVRCWRRAKAYQRTLERRPELLENVYFDKAEIQALEKLVQDVENSTTD